MISHSYNFRPIYRWFTYGFVRFNSHILMVCRISQPLFLDKTSLNLIPKYPGVNQHRREKPMVSLGKWFTNGRFYTSFCLFIGELPTPPTAPWPKTTPSRASPPWAPTSPPSAVRARSPSRKHPTRKWRLQRWELEGRDQRPVQRKWSDDVWWSKVGVPRTKMGRYII